jgi:cytochrome P450
MVKAESGQQLFGPEMLQDPFPAYQRLRDAEPVHWDDTMQAWVVTGYGAVSQLMKDRRFSSDRVTNVRHRYAERHQPIFDLLSRIMLQTDDPTHKRLRDHVHGAFTRTAVDTYADAIRGLCTSLLAPAVKRGEMEFVAEFAAPLPILVICEIVGIAAEERQQMKIWCDAFSTVALNFYTHLSDVQLDECGARIEAFQAYLRDKVEAAREAPGHDLISSLTVAADRGEGIDMDELIANCILLLNAGNETTTCLLANGLGLLLQHPEQMALLRQQPELIPDAVEEFLRLQTPVQFVGRIALEDVELGGKPIRQGQMVLPVLGAANRDPDKFARPDALDVTRTHLHQLAFGTGPHLCAGIQLARLEGRIAFETLFETVSDIEAMSDRFVVGPNFNMRCLETLPIRLRC